MKKFYLILLCLLLNGCSISNVQNRGEYIDPQSIKPFTTRYDIQQRFGFPIRSEELNDGRTIDFFKVKQGESDKGKAAKSYGLLMAGIATLGISELIATPATSIDEFIYFAVIYNYEYRAIEVKFFDKDSNLNKSNIDLQ